ncbi:MAG TPA: diguanylate cyclase [Gemmatimonadaceae bacterium]|nr:diguanylate cyclase [Gemmatimonadaceae bacterium]
MTGAPIRVLVIVESEGDVRRLHGAVAGRASQFELVHVTRVHEAMKRLRDPGRFDAVLLDLGLPDGEGLEPLEQLHEAAPKTPIIVMSHVEDEELAMRALKAGAQDSLVKGQVDGQLLVRAIRYAIERQQLHAALREMSLVDPLTQLYNRRGLITLARQLYKVADRMKRRVFHIFVDLDGLKMINDTLGHGVGDRALIETTDLLKETFRDSDVMARLGGDEFVVLAMENAGADAEIWTQRLQDNLRQRNARADRDYPLSLSVGIVWYDPDAPRALDDLLERADSLMYQEKRAKRLSPAGGIMLPTPSKPFPAYLTRAD